MWRLQSYRFVMTVSILMIVWGLGGLVWLGAGLALIIPGVLSIRALRRKDVGPAFELGSSASYRSRPWLSIGLLVLCCGLAIVLVFREGISQQKAGETKSKVRRLIGRGGEAQLVKEYDVALQCYSEAIVLVPDLRTAHLRLAWLLATCPDVRYRDGKRALNLVNRIPQGEDRFTFDYGYSYHYRDAMEVIAAAHAELGDFDRAVNWQSRAVELSPYDSRFLGTSVYNQAWKQASDRLKLYKERKPCRDGCLAPGTYNGD